MKTSEPNDREEVIADDADSEEGERAMRGYMSMVAGWSRFFSTAGTEQSQEQILSTFHERAKQDIEDFKGSPGTKNLYYRKLADRYWRSFVRRSERGFDGEAYSALLEERQANATCSNR